VKYLILIVVLYFVYSYIRRNKQSQQAAKSEFSNNGPQIMIECNHCGVHFPKSDAVIGNLGPYCCSNHLQAKEKN